MCGAFYAHVYKSSPRSTITALISCPFASHTRRRRSVQLGETHSVELPVLVLAKQISPQLRQHLQDVSVRPEEDSAPLGRTFSSRILSLSFKVLSTLILPPIALPMIPPASSSFSPLSSSTLTLRPVISLYLSAADLEDFLIKLASFGRWVSVTFSERSFRKTYRVTCQSRGLT